MWTGWFSLAEKASPTSLVLLKVPSESRLLSFIANTIQSKFYSFDTLDNRATASVLRSSLSASVRPRITGQTLQGSIIWGVGYIPTSMLQLLCCRIYSLATLFTCSSTSLVSAKPCSRRTNSAAWLVFRTLFKIMLQRRQLRITRNKYNLIIGVREKPDNQGQ